MACGTVDIDRTGVTPDFIALSSEEFVLPEGVPDKNSDIQLKRGLEVMQTELFS